MNKGEIALEILAIDHRIEELEEIRAKAQISSPASRMLWAIENGVSNPLFNSSSLDYESWNATDDGITFKDACGDLEDLRRYRKKLLSGISKELTKKLNLRL